MAHIQRGKVIGLLESIFIYCICTQYLVGAPFALITISFKLHMTINEINTTLLLECHYQSLLSVCNNFWLRSNVDFGQMIRQKYVVSNILEEFYVEDTQLQLLWGVKKKQ